MSVETTLCYRHWQSSGGHSGRMAGIGPGASILINAYPSQKQDYLERVADQLPKWRARPASRSPLRCCASHGVNGLENKFPERRIVPETPGSRCVREAKSSRRTGPSRNCIHPIFQMRHAIVLQTQRTRGLERQGRSEDQNPKLVTHLLKVQS